jgi:hypothetical protein
MEILRRKNWRFARILARGGGGETNGMGLGSVGCGCYWLHNLIKFFL